MLRILSLEIGVATKRINAVIDQITKEMKKFDGDVIVIEVPHIDETHKTTKEMF